MFSGRSVEPSGYILPHIAPVPAAEVPQTGSDEVHGQQIVSQKAVHNRPSSSGTDQDDAVMVPVAISELTLYQQRVRCFSRA